jgi:hypothetical protein
MVDRVRLVAGSEISIDREELRKHVFPLVEEVGHLAARPFIDLPRRPGCARIAVHARGRDICCQSDEMSNDIMNGPARAGRYGEGRIEPLSQLNDTLPCLVVQVRGMHEHKYRRRWCDRMSRSRTREPKQLCTPSAIGTNALGQVSDNALSINS